MGKSSACEVNLRRNVASILAERKPAAAHANSANGGLLREEHTNFLTRAGFPGDIGERYLSVAHDRVRCRFPARMRTSENNRLLDWLGRGLNFEHGGTGA